MELVPQDGTRFMLMLLLFLIYCKYLQEVNNLI